MAGLRAASTPSCVTVGCPTHGGEPVAQTKFVASSASPSGKICVTVSSALELVAEPPVLVTTSEYVPACATCAPVMRKVAFVAPLMLAPSLNGTPFNRHRYVNGAAPFTTAENVA